MAGNSDTRPAVLGKDHGHDERSFLLQRVQPAMAGLMDGSLSTLAPIFAVALATRQPHYAFFAGLAVRDRRGREHGLLGRSFGHRRPDRSR